MAVTKESKLFRQCKKQKYKRREKKMKKILLLLLVSGLIFSCAKKEKEIVLRVGASPIPHSEILKIAEEE